MWEDENESVEKDPVTLVLEKPLFDFEDASTLRNMPLERILELLQGVGARNEDLQLIAEVFRKHRLNGFVSLSEIEELAKTIGEILPIGSESHKSYQLYPTTSQWLMHPTKPNNCIIPNMVMSELLRRLGIPHLCHIDNNGENYKYRHPHLLIEMQNAEEDWCIYRIDYMVDEPQFKSVCQVSTLSDYANKYGKRGHIVTNDYVLNRVVDYLHVLYLVKLSQLHIGAGNIESLTSLLYEFIDFCIEHHLHRVLDIWTIELPLLAGLRNMSQTELLALQDEEDEDEPVMDGMEILTVHDLENASDLLPEDFDWDPEWDKLLDDEV